MIGYSHHDPYVIITCLGSGELQELEGCAKIAELFNFHIVCRHR